VPPARSSSSAWRHNAHRENVALSPSSAEPAATGFMSFPSPSGERSSKDLSASRIIGGSHPDETVGRVTGPLHPSGGRIPRHCAKVERDDVETREPATYGTEARPPANASRQVVRGTDFSLFAPTKAGHGAGLRPAHRQDCLCHVRPRNRGNIRHQPAGSGA